jgi:hypothetical protein
MPNHYGPLPFAFIFLTLTLASGLVFLLRRLFPIPKWKCAVPLTCWLGLQALLAKAGFFLDFQALPPHLGLILLPNIALLFFAGLGLRSSPAFAARLASIPAAILIGYQSFRLVMETILYALVANHQLPPLMSFEGSNFDVLVGLTAPVMATLLYWSKDPRTYQVAIVWNFVSFGILTNTVFHAILAAPTPFQAYFTNPPNTLIGEFPWIWLPGFVVPCALVGHILSIRQLRLLRSAG